MNSSRNAIPTTRIPNQVVIPTYPVSSITGFRSSLSRCLNEFMSSGRKPSLQSLLISVSLTVDVVTMQNLLPIYGFGPPIMLII